jgi:nitrogenase molybdenum-iron protein beta chain
MSDLVEAPRFVCALGAIKSVQAIDRAVPVLHSGPGCGAKLAGGISEQNGGSPSGYISPQIYPCSNIGEREVVFGGADRLRQTIENALKVIDGDIFVALTGCTSALVGDDAEEVVRSFKGAEKPVILADTPGFIGNNIRGHEIVLDALIEQYMKPARLEAGLVNIWATVPYQDAFWHGNLRALERLVAALGLKPNTIFGPRKGIAALDRVSAASLNILASPWAGLDAVRKLEAKFGTPYMHYPTIPIGPCEAGEFLRAVGAAAGVPSPRVEEAIRAGEEEYYYYIERSADVFLETRAMARRFAVIADSDYCLAVSRFLVNDMGLFPSKLYITDDAPIEHRDRITGYFGDFLHGIKAEVEFSVDGGAIHEEIRNTNFYGRPLILGSYWERSLAKELRGHYVGIAMPVVDRLILDRSYVGYEGALRLLEDIYGIVLETFI